MTIDEAELIAILARIEVAHDQLLAVELGAIDEDDVGETLYWARQEVAQAGDLLEKALGIRREPHLRLVWPAPKVDDDIPF
jgi:hypothetical protein